MYIPDVYDNKINGFIVDFYVGVWWSVLWSWQPGQKLHSGQFFRLVENVSSSPCMHICASLATITAAAITQTLIFIISYQQHWILEFQSLYVSIVCCVLCYISLSLSLSLCLSVCLSLSLSLSLIHTYTVSSNVVDYYIVCNETCVSSPFQEAYDNATQAFQLIPTAEMVVREYINDQNRSDLLVGH